jgi:hypothetical protein
MIDEERAENALMYLRDTAKQYGQARGHALYTDSNLRRVKALQMMSRQGGVGEREAAAYASEEYLAAIEAARDAETEVQTVMALRDAAEYTIKMWQTQSASRRQGVNI